MAIGKTAACLILAGAGWASAVQFPVRHEHWRKGCEGVMTVDENGVSFSGPKDTGGEHHAWAWKFQDIQELELAPRSIHILTYKGSRLGLGAGKRYAFTGEIPAGHLYALLRERMDQRFVARLDGQAGEIGAPELTLPVKHQGRVLGSEGTLAFSRDSVVYSTGAKNQSRTWRYTDIDSISSSGRFQLTIKTLEKGFNFQLKQSITEASYNQLWLEIEKKNGRIQ